MSTPPAAVFPGPASLGRGVVVGDGQPTPDGFPDDAPRIRIDDLVLAHPEPAVTALHHHWVSRTPVVVELVADNATMRAKETDDRMPWDLPHGFTFLRERLHFLTWANTYDARSGEPIWWHGELAVRKVGAERDDVADVLLDGTPVWCDGGPRGPIDGGATVDGHRLLHRETIGRHQATLLGDRQPDRTQLADDQWAAVTHAAGPARIVAPAGSGKTRVLTARLQHLLRDRRYEPAVVTAVAYNTRAAHEMRDRMTGVRADIRTLHSLGLWICNLEGRRDLVDERGQRAILDRLVTTARIPNTDPYQAYLEALSECRLGLEHPDHVEARRDDVDDLSTVVRRYREELTRRNQMDFDEQIFHAIELLLTNPGIREVAQERCTHLLVDEFQDLTPAFHLLVRLVASPELQVFAVGDDDQVIYGYAGADPDYLVDFGRDFPGASFHPLEVNYRCPTAVVRGAVGLLSHNDRRVDKQIRPGPDASDEEVAHHAVDAGAMAGRATHVIEEWIGAGTPPSQVAVLARVNATLLPVQVSLGMAEIPRTAPLDTNVLRRTGVRTALAYLRLGLDTDRMRREDLMETINRPARKMKSAVSDHLQGRRFSMSQLRSITSVLSKTHGQRWSDYLDELQALADTITRGEDTAACLALVRSRIGLGEAMATLDSSTSRPEGSSHADDLDALAQLALLHPDPATYQEWLRLELERPGDEDGVVLSSIHRVKGMEWDRVLVFAANNGLFPHRLSDDVEEERRVFHVAVTRARKGLAVVADRAAVSPFVDEIRFADAPAPAGDLAAATVEEIDEVSPTTNASGKIMVEPGLRLGLPGGVEGVVRGTSRHDGVTMLDLTVAGAAARIALDAPITVDGAPAQLELRAARVRPRGLFDDDPAPRLLQAGGGDTDDELTPDEEARFQALREWRTTMARQHAVPPYVVFSDATLRGISRRNPVSDAELLSVSGIGPTKLDRYGDDVLAVLEETG